MAFPMKGMEVGKLVDLKTFALTVAAIPVSATSRPTMAISIQNQSDDQGVMLVGDAGSQSRRVADGATSTVQAGDANNVYMRAAVGTATVNVHLLVPAQSR